MSSLAKFRIAVCSGPECAGKRAGDAVNDRLARLLAELGLGDRVTLERRVCFGRCTLGPNLHVRGLDPSLSQGDFESLGSQPRPRSALYNGVGEDDVHEIIESHILGNRPVRRLMHRIGHHQPDPASPAAPPAVSGPASGAQEGGAVSRDPGLAKAARSLHASSDVDPEPLSGKKPNAGD